MNCPFCNTILKKTDYKGIEIDKCPMCKGTWFDNNELELFVDYIYQEYPDLPNQKFNFNKEIINPYNNLEFLKKCPRCLIELEKINYFSDSNIIIDKCKKCNGIWLDAEEESKIAIYNKGNPIARELGHQVLTQNKEEKDLEDIADAFKEMKKTNAFVWKKFSPIIIFPIKDNLKSSVIPYITFIIILLNLLVFIMQFFNNNAKLFFINFGLIPLEITNNKNYYTFITSIFIHGNFFHLLGNMFFLWLFGDNVEDKLGHIKYLIFYLFIGILTGILYYLFNIYSKYIAIGASGAISGIMGVYYVLYPHSKVKTLIFNKLVDIPSFIFLGIWFILQILLLLFFLAIGMKSPVLYLSHISGFCFGFIYIKYIFHKIF